MTHYGVRESEVPFLPDGNRALNTLTADSTRAGFLVMDSTAAEVRARPFREVDLEPVPSRPGEPPRAIVPLKASGTTVPLFIIHQFFGEVFQYKRVAERIRDDIPVYGVEARGLRDGLEPRDSIPDMAVAYLEEIRQVQPHGPYLLSGFSFGGRVAWEMARRLEAEGEDVRLLLIDVGPRVTDRAELSAITKIGRILMYHWRVWRGLEGPSRASYRHTVFQEEMNKLGERLRLDPTGSFYQFLLRFGRERPRGHLPVFRDHSRAMAEWEFEPYPRPFTLLRTELQAPNEPEQPTLGFTPDLHPGGIDVRPVSGTHTFVFNEPHANSLVAQIEVWFDRQKLAAPVQTGASTPLDRPGPTAH